jgi:hypothetical protein
MGQFRQGSATKVTMLLQARRQADHGIATSEVIAARLQQTRMTASAAHAGGVFNFKVTSIQFLAAYAV